MLNSISFPHKRCKTDDARNVNLKDRPDWSRPWLILILREVNELQGVFTGVVRAFDAKVRIARSKKMKYSDSNVYELEILCTFG